MLDIAPCHGYCAVMKSDDDNVPAARTVRADAEPLEIRRATRRPSDLTLARPPATPTDSLAILLDERRQK